MRITDLKTYELQMVIEFFMHHLSGDLRHKLMHELPHIYNKLVGREVMTTINQTREEISK